MTAAKPHWLDRQFGWYAVTIRYTGMLALVYGLYRWLTGLAGAAVPPAAWTGQVWAAPAQVWAGLNAVWLIFAWGFIVQGLIGLVWVIRRRPNDGHWQFQVRRSWWVSAHAGLFEELIFRYFGFISFVVVLRLADAWSSGWLGQAAQQWVGPVMNWLSLGLFREQLVGAQWSIGLAAVIAAAFFRSAHVHYGRLAKANVWVIGVVMFWLVFHFGVITAIAAHVLYDFAVFSAILLTSPLQPAPKTEA